MSKINFRIGVALMLLWSVVSSCTERIELDVLTQEPKLVVFGFLSNRPNAYCIELNRTTPFFGVLDTAHIAVSGAIVAINGERLQEDSENRGKYHTRSNFEAVPGTSYVLRIEVDFDQDGVVDVYESTTVMPEKQVLDSVSVVPNIMPMFGKTSITVSFNYYFQPQLGTYPGASFSFMGTQFVDRVTRHMLSPLGRITDNHYVSGFPFFMIRPDFFTTLSNDTVFFTPGGRFELGLRAYTPALFEFLRVASVESSPGNPLFSGPPANVPSNISNGAYGCFGAYSEVLTDVNLPWEEKYFQGKWVNRFTGMVIEVIGDQAIIVEKGASNSFSTGDVFLKDIRIDNDSSQGVCQIMEGDEFQPDKLFWYTYFYFRFIRNGGMWMRL